MPQRRATLASKNAMLAADRPYVVHPREVAKCTKEFAADPEIILGCIVVSGTLDTSIVVHAIVHEDAKIPNPPD
jgi:hypothetical protein